jgi:ATP-dependent RNA helicase DeaD
MSVGRRQNADPRWILPLICRRGHISRAEIGAIRIAQNETMFEVPQAVASRFLDAVRRTASEGDDDVEIIAADGKPRETARENRREHPARDNRAPRPQHPGGPRSDGPRHDGPRKDGPRKDGPRHDGPRAERKPGGKKGNWGKRP